jgi:hypothetical protein
MPTLILYIIGLLTTPGTECLNAEGVPPASEALRAPGPYLGGEGVISGRRVTGAKPDRTTQSQRSQGGQDPLSTMEMSAQPAHQRMLAGYSVPSPAFQRNCLCQFRARSLPSLYAPA